MEESELIKQIEENDRRLREQLPASANSNSEEMKNRITDRMKRIANTRESDPPEEEFLLSEEAVERVLDERKNYLRDARSKKWDSKVPPRWSSWKLDDLPKGFRVAANSWIAESFPNSGNMILSGPTGSGKTSMAYAISREIYLLGHKVKIWQTAELFDQMRLFDESKDILDSVKNADLLVLDDLGSERKTEWVEERLFLIIDYRWQWKLPVIITTNLTAEKLPEKISERVVSRLMDDAAFIVVDGKDYRLDGS